MAKLETRAVAVRAIKDDQFQITGRAVTYGALSGDLGGFRERVAAGAFTRHLASNPEVKCLFNHSPDKVLGRTKNGTLVLTDTPLGLDFRCQLDPNQQSHRDLYAAVKR